MDNGGNPALLQCLCETRNKQTETRGRGSLVATVIATRNSGSRATRVFGHVRQPNAIGVYLRAHHNNAAGGGSEPTASEATCAVRYNSPLDNTATTSA